ncbi:hypothetical protein JST56_04790 [Candidatus Dependentiae bacterium]|jgi:hypothetical protein|nr:hypothetical protein [Candidatus Dependentiae bacterium]
MKRMMFVMAIVATAIFGRALAQSNLYVAIIDVENSSFVCQETMSLEVYAELLKNGEDVALKEEFPNAAFALIYIDPETGALTPTDAQAQLKLFRQQDPNWYARNVTLKNILKKSGKLFLNTLEVVMLITCWTGSEVLIPGSLELYKHGNTFAKWARDQYREAFPNLPAAEAV